MEEALWIHRLQFGFTSAYHYLFPQLTMGLAMIIFLMRLRSGKNPLCHAAADFWTRIFALHFAFGVVTGIPLEFQFGTNWALFSEKTGGLIGQLLGMEGMFSFFLESTFLGLLIYGRDRLSAVALRWVSGLLFLGTWLSGYFIIVTNAWMQHPVGYALDANGQFILTDLSAVMLNPWAFAQFAHTMCGSMVTASFAVAAVGAFYQLNQKHSPFARLFLTWGIRLGFLFSVLQIVPTGDIQGAQLAHHQPITLAAMEGHFDTEEGAGIAILGQPDMDKLTLDNPLVVPKMLSFLTHKRWNAEVKGLKDFPREDWPDQIPLLYYCYHIMVGLGTFFLTLMGFSLLWSLRKKLEQSKVILWALMLVFPFPYIANTAGWMTAELGRQPWLVYGLMRTHDGASPQVSSGNALFSLLGFFGLYTVLTLLVVALTGRCLVKGPQAQEVPNA
ncbi:MAG: cytochrome ubiquinol oxidase subunit I [Acidobacteria bacterium]|nr:cytochrome ubiquinol oxidase subunit I [Acidobacteriota bacterium]